MTTGVTTPAAFAKRAEQWKDKAPVMAALCRTIAAEPELAACVEVGPVLTVEGRPQHTNVWARPHLMFALVTRLLRTAAMDHALAGYWPTLGGERAMDAGLAEVFRDFVRGHRTELIDLALARPASRQNNPAAAAMLWPGIAWAVQRLDTPVALLELGSAAGVCLYPDRYGYRYGDRTLRADSPLVLDCDFGGEVPEFLDAEPTVAARVGLERDPIRREDADAVAWLRDCVFPDHVDRLADMDGAMSVIEPGGIDWRVGDYMETLPEALAELPGDVTPIVYEANTLCCAPRPERLPRILADSGRDLVWISDEHAGNGLGLVADAGGYEAEPQQPPVSLLTAVAFEAGRLREVRVLAEIDPMHTSLTWSPRAVQPIG